MSEQHSHRRTFAAARSERPSDSGKEAIAPLEFPQDFPIDAIREAVESIRFGVVQLVIQDGRIIQIDKTEKVRLI